MTIIVIHVSKVMWPIVAYPLFLLLCNTLSCLYSFFVLFWWMENECMKKKKMRLRNVQKKYSCGFVEDTWCHIISHFLVFFSRAIHHWETSHECFFSCLLTGYIFLVTDEVKVVIIILQYYASFSTLASGKQKYVYFLKRTKKKKNNSRNLNNGAPPFLAHLGAFSWCNKKCTFYSFPANLVWVLSVMSDFETMWNVVTW